MSSSRSDAALRAIARSYDEALEAVLKGDLARAESLLQACERCCSTLPASGEAADPQARAGALEAHGRLLDALRQQKDATLRELRAVAAGRRMLAGYGGRAEPTGRRCSTDV